MSGPDGGPYSRRAVLGSFGLLGATATASGPVPGSRSVALVAPPRAPGAPPDAAYEGVAAGLADRLPGVATVTVRRLGDRAAVLRAVCEGEVGVAAVDPYVAWLADARGAADALCQVRADAGWAQRSHLLVRADADVAQPAGLADDAVALGPLLSLAGSAAPLGRLTEAGCFDGPDRATTVTWRRPADAVAALEDGAVAAAGTAGRVREAVTPVTRSHLRSLAATPAVPAGPVLVTPSDHGPPAERLSHAIETAVAAADATDETARSSRFTDSRPVSPAVLGRIGDLVPVHYGAWGDR